MPTLLELEARFLKHEDDHSSRLVDTLAEADGIMFVCPKCFITRGGRAGAHSIICWFKGKVPDTLDPKPGRWNPSGTGLGDLTFVGPGSTSVLLQGGCNAHFHVVKGQIQHCEPVLPDPR